MATTKKRRDPLAIESPETAASRRRAINAALANGALRGYMAAMLRREFLTERAVRAYEIEAAVLFARQVEAPLLIAVAGALGTRPEALAPAIATTGTPIVIPPPASIPSGLSSTMARVFADGGRKVFDSIDANVTELAAQEVATTARAMAKHFGPAALAGDLANVPVTTGPEPKTGPLLPPTADQLARRLVERAKGAPVFGTTVEKAWGKSLDGLRGKIEAKIGEALQRGATNDDIVRMLRGTKAQKYADGLLPSWRGYSIKNFVRTIATHVSAQSREGSFAALGVPYVQLVATLDLRTTPQCVSLDRTIWPVGEGPRPPIHPGCRTAVAPSWSATSDDKPEYGGTRASKDGPVSSTLDAREWWRDLPAGEQDIMVGKAKAAALRSGRIEWSQLFGPGMEPLTNAQLRALGLLPAA